MNKPHKHAKVIKAWADGIKIQWRGLGSLYLWRDIDEDVPTWSLNVEYRIKPVKKSAGQVMYEALVEVGHLGEFELLAAWEELHENTQSYYIRCANRFLEAQKNGEIDGYN